MLYLVPTPIGNLADITFRAIEVLQSVDYILCEDTRRVSILLNHYKIHKTLKVFHKFNESRQQQKIIDDLQKDLHIALVSDAGTVSIADPGARLIQQCHALKLAVTALPGASAIVTALSFTGLFTDRFQFLGYFPKKRQELLHFLHAMRTYPGISIAFETPHRLCKTLALMHEEIPSSTIHIAKELTKKFENLLSASAAEHLAYFEQNPPKGEFTILLQGEKQKHDHAFEQAEQIFRLLMSSDSLSKGDAIKRISHILDIPKNQLYYLAKNDELL